MQSLLTKMLLKSQINAKPKGYDKRPLKSLISEEFVDKNALEVTDGC